MSVSFDIHNVARIEVSAYSSHYNGSDRSKMHVQNLFLYDKNDNKIADIGIFLDNPNSAMRIGDTSRLDLVSVINYSI